MKRAPNRMSLALVCHSRSERVFAVGTKTKARERHNRVTFTPTLSPAKKKKRYSRLTDVNAVCKPLTHNLLHATAAHINQARSENFAEQAKSRLGGV